MNFEEFYNEIYEKYKDELETVKKEINKEKRKNKIKKIFLILLVLFLLIFNMICISKEFSFISENFRAFLGAIVEIGAVIILILHFKKGKKYYEYFDIYRRKIIQSLIEKYDYELDYKSGKAMDIGIYSKACVNNIGSYFSNNYISGWINENKKRLKIQLAKVCVSYGKEENKINIINPGFWGLFAAIETPRSFKTWIYIRKDKRDRNIIAKEIEKKSDLHKLNLRMDSPEFEKLFDVYALNKIMAMQLLTADIMEDLVKFYNEFGYKFEIVFKNNYIYISIDSEDLFKPLLEKEFALDKEKIYNSYSILNFIFNLTTKVIDVLEKTEL